jgi:Ca2+-binding EF-hand superfamily protein
MTRRQTSISEIISSPAYKSRRTINHGLMSNLSSITSFTPKQMQYLKENFLKIAPKGIMSLEGWKKSMGIMNVPRADHIARQIFNAIDTDRDGFVFFEDYVSFTDILISGSIQDKARYSFRMLDFENKGFISENDVNMMMASLFELWNIMTGSKVVVLPEYTQRVYRMLDANGDRKIDLEEYTALYSKEKMVFGWYEWLNQGKLGLSQTSTSRSK